MVNFTYIIQVQQKNQNIPLTLTPSPLFCLLLVLAFQVVYTCCSLPCSHPTGILPLVTLSPAVLVSVDRNFPEFHSISCSWLSSFLSHQIFSTSFVGSSFSTCTLDVPQGLSSIICCLYFTLCLLWFRLCTYSINSIHRPKLVGHYCA